MYNVISDYDDVILCACADKRTLINGLKSMGINVRAIDYDPKFKDNPSYECKDFIFDDVDLSADLVVHFNCEKTYPILCEGDVLLIGDDKRHSADCNPITSCQQLIDQNKIIEVYDTKEITQNRITHYFVHGRK